MTEARVDTYPAERAFWEQHGVEPTEHMIEVREPRTQLRVQEAGIGDPVLFIHGTGGPGTYFAPLARYLRDRRCLFMDRPGWGSSQPLEYAGRRYGEVTAQLVRGLLDGLDVKCVDVVGASIGDLWALRFAQAEPDRVRRIVLLGGGPLTSAIEVPPFIRLLRSPLGRVIVALPEKAWMLRRQMASMGHGKDAIPESFIGWHVEMSRATDWSRHEREMVRTIVGRDGFTPGLIPREDEVAAIRQPMLMVVGSEDPVGSLEIWERFTKGFPNGSLEVVDVGGHLVWYDDEQRVGDLVRRFLN